MFTDCVKVKLLAGKGGNGVVAWHRERYIRKGGPSGGNGGRGGSIILVGDTQISSLDYFRNRRQIRAENGIQGGNRQMNGRYGKDLTLKVPCGTLIKDAQTGEVLCDITEDKQKFIICQGGRGGLGNTCFKTPTNQAPNYCTPGKEGEIKDIELELKVIADVGLVGYPNAGKSTFINTVSRQKVKVAPYPFTTLRPNLGFVPFEDYSRMLIADIPGLIEGAHQDKGLGFEFLKHVERTKVLAFVLDSSGIDGRDPLSDLHVLKKELYSYSEDLANKPFCILLNKVDTEESKENLKEFYAANALDQDKIFECSALDGTGVQDILARLKTLVEQERAAEEALI